MVLKIARSKMYNVRPMQHEQRRPTKKDKKARKNFRSVGCHEHVALKEQLLAVGVNRERDAETLRSTLPHHCWYYLPSRYYVQAPEIDPACGVAEPDRLDWSTERWT